VVDLASPSISNSLEMPVRRVGSRGTTFSSQTSHWGLNRAVHLLPIQEANPSLSQRLSHQAIVTRSPNHWCAVSCAITSKMLSFVFSEDFVGSKSRMLS